MTVKMEVLTCLSHAVSTFDFLKCENGGSSNSGHPIIIICKAKSRGKPQSSQFDGNKRGLTKQCSTYLPCCLLQELGCSFAHPGIHFHPRPVPCLVVQVGSSTSPSSERPHCGSAHLCFENTREQLKLKKQASESEDQ